ncbi:hypothetical protein RIF29_17599 [Crotalaria pallida]|uniref:HMG box domain-containing protein n=1 Tax=Crotalaria pallida TaxID=3830 RepID=A0AAN9IGK8_CROPI
MTKIKKLSNGAIIIRDAPPPNQQQREIRCQPVSAYRLFMDEYTKGCDMKKYFERDHEGHRKWKAMTNAEKYPFVWRSKMLENYHKKLLKEEASAIKKIDDEADSSDAPGREHEKYEVSYGSSESESWSDSSSSSPTTKQKSGI